MSAREARHGGPGPARLHRSPGGAPIGTPIPADQRRLSGAGLESVRTRIERTEISFASEEEWWAWKWSYSIRGILEQMDDRDVQTILAQLNDQQREAALHGTTALIDHHESPSFIEGSLDVVADACQEFGMPALLCYGATERNGGRDEAARGPERLRLLLEGAVHRLRVEAAHLAPGREPGDRPAQHLAGRRVVGCRSVALDGPSDRVVLGDSHPALPSCCGPWRHSCRRRRSPAARAPPLPGRGGGGRPGCGDEGKGQGKGPER